MGLPSRLESTKTRRITTNIDDCTEKGNLFLLFPFFIILLYLHGKDQSTSSHLSLPRVLLCLKERRKERRKQRRTGPDHSYSFSLFSLHKLFLSTTSFYPPFFFLSCHITHVHFLRGAKPSQGKRKRTGLRGNVQRRRTYV